MVTAGRENLRLTFRLKLACSTCTRKAERRSSAHSRLQNPFLQLRPSFPIESSLMQSAPQQQTPPQQPPQGWWEAAQNTPVHPANSQGIFSGGAPPPPPPPAVESAASAAASQPSGAQLPTTGGAAAPAIQPQAPQQQPADVSMLNGASGFPQPSPQFPVCTLKHASRPHNPTLRSSLRQRIEFRSSRQIIPPGSSRSKRASRRTRRTRSTSSRPKRGLIKRRCVLIGSIAHIA